MKSTVELVERLLAGETRAAARLITLIENRDPDVPSLIRQIHPHTGNAYVVGITGPPGAGKSTLVDKLCKELRSEGMTVGIIAVDPSSPFTRGALLGDRIRMQEHSTDPGTFIRSMASRDALGGLAEASKDAVKVLDALGKDFVILETVGAGQLEFDIIQAADTVVVVLVPGLGDAIQMIKAGIMEIGDIFDVNMADRPGADHTVAELEAMLRASPGEAGWRPPVLRTVATSGEGVRQLLDSVHRHRGYMQDSGEMQRRREEQARHELMDLVQRRLRKMAVQQLVDNGLLTKVAAEVSSRRKDPHSAADELFRSMRAGGT